MKKNVVIFKSNDKNWLLLDTIDAAFYYQFLRKIGQRRFISSLNLINATQAEEVCPIECDNPKCYRLIFNYEVVMAESAKDIMCNMLTNFDILRNFVNPVLFEIYDFNRAMDIIKRLT